MILLLECLQGSGGEERFASTFLHNFVSRYIDVELTVLHEGTSFYSLPSNIPVSILDLQDLRPSEKLSVEIPLNLLGERESFVWLEFVSSKLADHLIREKIDCVLATNFLTSILAYKASLRSKAKAIGMFAGHFSATLVWNLTHKDFRTFWAPRLRDLNPIICISQGIAGDLSANWGIPRENLRVIYYPLDIDRVRRMSQETVSHPWFAERIPIFLFVGRLAKQKGIEFLLKALKIVNSVSPARLIMVGEGAEKGSLQELARELNLENKVAFVGADLNQFKYMKQATALVLPSLFEGLAYVIMEALACGCPVISTDCPSGPAELLQGGKYGLLVPPENEHTLATAMLNLLQDPELRAKLSQLGPQHAQDFEASKIAKEYEQLILEVAGAKTWSRRIRSKLERFFSSSPR